MTNRTQTKPMNAFVSTILILTLMSNINMTNAYTNLTKKSNVSVFRKLSEDPMTNVNCSSFTNHKCVCPGKCMEYSNKTKDCVVDKCYGWDDMNNLCVKTGKSFTTVIILTAIPVTGGAGIGQMIMGRWDMVSIIWGPVVGAIFIICVLPCIGKCFGASSETTEECGLCTSTILGGLVSCNTFIVWIVFIVLVATKKMLDGNGCELV